jgi:hypothetical protein
MRQCTRMMERCASSCTAPALPCLLPGLVSPACCCRTCPSGNDLSRTFNWGDCFYHTWIKDTSSIYATLKRVRRRYLQAACGSAVITGSSCQHALLHDSCAQQQQQAGNATGAAAGTHGTISSRLPASLSHTYNLSWPHIALHSCCDSALLCPHLAVPPAEPCVCMPRCADRRC